MAYLDAIIIRCKLIRMAPGHEYGGAQPTILIFGINFVYYPSGLLFVRMQAQPAFSVIHHYHHRYNHAILPKINQIKKWKKSEWSQQAWSEEVFIPYSEGKNRQAELNLRINAEQNWVKCRRQSIVMKNKN